MVPDGSLLRAKSPLLLCCAKAGANASASQRTSTTAALDLAAPAHQSKQIATTLCTMLYIHMIAEDRG